MRQDRHDGHVPLNWFSAAARLPGRSLHAALAVWVLAGQSRSEQVGFTNVIAERFGLDRNSKYRALDWLEQAGLVRVERKLGRSPLVTLLDPGSNP